MNVTLYRKFPLESFPSNLMLVTGPANFTTAISSVNERKTDRSQLNTIPVRTLFKLILMRRLKQSRQVHELVLVTRLVTSRQVGGIGVVAKDGLIFQENSAWKIKKVKVPTGVP